MKNDLISSINKIHTTAMGEARIRKNLNLRTGDVVKWCREKIIKARKITREGKNWYAYTGDCVITVNAASYTIITAHKEKQRRGRAIMYSLIIATAAGKEESKKIAGILVERKLASCVQLFPIESIYFWKDKVFDEKEIMLFIKSKKSLFNEIKAAIKEIHSYEVPEIIQIPITDGLPEYLKWIGDNTLNPPQGRFVQAP